MNITPLSSGQNITRRLMRDGDVELQWRNKKFHKGEKGLNLQWHHYSFLPPTDAKRFIETTAKNSKFFEYRIK